MKTRQTNFIFPICILLFLSSCRSRRHSEIAEFHINAPDSYSKTWVNKNSSPVFADNNHLVISPSDKPISTPIKKGNALLNKKPVIGFENGHKTSDYRSSHIKQVLKKAVTNNNHTSGFKKGLLMILLALLLFGLGYIFYTSLGVLGLFFYIIFGIAAAIYFIVGLVTMLFG
ncbi:MAG: hypothetical protein V4613_13025 [Bacteroidota bacterium]